jgi:hypothetical protein
MLSPDRAGRKPERNALDGKPTPAIALGEVLTQDVLTGAARALFVGVCAGAPSLTLDLGPGWLRVGDMMVDGVTPGDGLRPLGLSRPSPESGRQGHAGSWPRFIG